MSAPNCPHFYFIFYFLILYGHVVCWDNSDLELFDLVEEVNQNFYDLLGVANTATSSEIKKAYRKKTLILHPDKNEAADAEEQFRQLVAVYEILKDEEKREKYNLVLQNGLPDWRQPVFYYRKARKLGLIELLLVLCAICTVGHYFVMWAVYLERRLAMEDFFESKRKRETKGKRGKAAIMNEKLEEDMHTTLQAIPRPQLSKLWPITLTILTMTTITTLPARMRERKEHQRALEERIRIEREEREKQELAYKEEQEQRKQRRKVKTEREFVPLCESTGAPVVYGQMNQTDSEEEEERFKQTKDGQWTDEDYVMLSKAYIKFPGGTLKRWDKIAEMVGRPVSEVTAKCKKMKGNLQMNLNSAVQGGTKNSKKQIDISNDIISKPTVDSLGSLSIADSTEPSHNTDTGVRKRTKTKVSRDPQRTLLIGVETVNQTASTIDASGRSDGKVDNSERAKTDKVQAKSDKIQAKPDKVQTRTDKVQSKTDKEQTKSDNDQAKSDKEQAKSDKMVLKDKLTNGNVGDTGDATKVDSGQPELDSWSQNQQVVLEWALKHFPKGTDQRWEKIAEHVPGKTKEECMQRFKYLAELIKQKKSQQS